MSRTQHPVARHGRWARNVFLPVVVLLVICAAVGLFLQPEVADRAVALLAPGARCEPPGEITSLQALLCRRTEDLEGVDIALMNLLCAEGLPGAEKLDIPKCLATLDQWAPRVKFETERHLYRLSDPRFKEQAEHYKHSEARFRAEWLVAVLQQDIGLHYHAGFVPQDVAVPPFKTSKETFLHGLMDHKDAHKAFGGNCVSLPVAYAAVGRRLGYPIRLVCAKEHVFCRWEGIDHPKPAWRDRFNFDGAGNGFSIDPDDFYMTWPRESTPDQAELAGWLKSLTPEQELAVFLCSRGAVLTCVNEDYPNALVAYAHAVRLWPTSSQVLQRLTRATGKTWEQQMAAHPEAFGRLIQRNMPEWKRNAEELERRYGGQATTQGRTER